MVAQEPRTGSPAETARREPGKASHEVARLRFSVTAPGPASALDGITVVLDTTWTPAPADLSPRVVGLRDVAERVLADRDLIAEAVSALDEWADASGVVKAMTIHGVSFWYGARLGHTMWLLDLILWLAVVDTLLREHPSIVAIDCDAGVDDALVVAARQLAGRDGLAFAFGGSTTGGARPATMAPGARRPSVSAAAPPRLMSLLLRLRRRYRRRRVAGRLAALDADAGRRLLVVKAHARQRVDTERGPRDLNPYLDPVVDRLRPSRLDPIEIDLRLTMDADAKAWARLGTAEGRRTLPADVLRLVRPVQRSEDAKAEAVRVATVIAAITTPLVVGGVDLGPTLARRVADKVSATFARRIVDVEEIRALLRRVHPAGVLLAVEYQRQDWLAAAGAEGVPVAAIQHGVIYRWHTGYVHGTRPAELRLPARTYVFGAWERDLLTSASVYRPDEVVVGGSPRLDLVRPAAVGGDHLRRELGVADGDRLVVLSGTWGSLYRRFLYPIALARLFDRPLERVHVVIKLHPSEPDEGPYRRIIAGLAAAGGFAPPPMSVVQSIDLYRLLAAADAHLGVHSTLLTEAAATATPNLLATGLAAADLLGYVDAGVAVPVRDAGDMLAALDRRRDEALRESDREAFVRRHFEPGQASGRIAADLLDWLR